MKRTRSSLKRSWLISGAVGCAACLPAAGQELDLSKLPPPADVTIDFAEHIQPILEENCWRCHGPERPKSGFRLDNREDALNSGEYGGNIIVGDSANSPLIHFVSHLEEEWEMPPLGEGDQLTDEQIGLLRAWIDQGLVWPETLENPIQFSMTTGVRFLAVSGNEQRFRQITGTREGFSGGVTDFSYEHHIDKDTQFTAEGRVWDEPHSYEFDLRYRKRNLGYVRIGVEQFRTYYNDVGGYYPPFDHQSFRLNEDLDLDQGNVLVELGLTKPAWPIMSLSYEYRYQEGTKSITQWGGHSEGTPPRNIRPSFKDIDQDIHVVRFDLDYDLNGYRIEDQARFEWLDLHTARWTDGSSSSSPDPVTLNRITRTEEDYEHFQGANFIRLEKQVKPWWLVSGGHHFSRVDGEARLNRSSTFSPETNPLFFVDADSQRIVLDRYSNTLNANTRLGPWEGLTFSAGVQGEWMRQEGMGRILFFESPDPGSVDSEIDRNVVQEKFILKYDRIPYTVIYAESQLQQDDIEQRERQRDGATVDFDRETRVDGNHREFGGGIEVSPWTWGSLNLGYSYRVRDNDFDHRVDESAAFDPEGSGNGFSAFIRGFEHERNELKAKLTLRPFANLKVNLAYQLIRTDYTTVTDPATGIVSANGQPERRVIAPGGEVEAGEYHSNVYSLGITYTPIRRLYLNGSFSYRDSKTETFANNSPAVVPYKTETYSALGSAVYIINEETDVNGGYTFSYSDSTRNNSPSSLSFGTEYEWHQIYAGLTRRINESLTTYWQYAFYYYDEPSTGNLNDFTGHGVFASLTWKWR